MPNDSDLAAPYYPIIYVRGYAGTQTEVEDTSADPFNGFNLGSTRLRQLWTGACARYYFESPLVRLMKDFSYRDVYDGGAEITGPPGINPRSLIIFRYYDRTSLELGDGTRLSIADAASDLSDLILSVRDRVCMSDHDKLQKFKVYLVAHSMGGLVCRCFLQNPDVGSAEAKAFVDKVFTYATPHNGIDVDLIGNVPSIFSVNDTKNFNRDFMRDYLALPVLTNGDVSSLNGKFDPDRVFNLVGTNDKDYAVAQGWSRRMVGPMSDGLVRISNATTWGPYTTANGTVKYCNSPRAFVNRSHSGYYGIVNSEEGYQNMTRFLFGDARVDGILEVKSISLPPKVQAALDAGKKIRASYNFEVIARVRGKLWDLHRRVADENSAIFRTFDEMLRPQNIAPDACPRNPQLFSVFLSSNQRVDKANPSLGFSVDLRVLVPQYEVQGILMFEDHYDGGYLFRDKINFIATPPASNNDQWQLAYGFDSATPNQASIPAMGKFRDDGVLEFRIPVRQESQPGIDADLVLAARPWNGKAAT